MLLHLEGNSLFGLIVIVIVVFFFSLNINLFISIEEKKNASLFVSEHVLILLIAFLLHFKYLFSNIAYLKLFHVLVHGLQVHFVKVFYVIFKIWRFFSLNILIYVHGTYKTLPKPCLSPPSLPLSLSLSPRKAEEKKKNNSLSLSWSSRRKRRRKRTSSSLGKNLSLSLSVCARVCLCY